VPTWDENSVHWKKSAKSAQNGNCVEIAELPGLILVRDSKDAGPGRPVLAVTRAEWRGLLSRVRAGELDLS
jgi:hypothetical protein